MTKQNLWKTTELMPLLKSRGINLSESQVYRLVTSTPERIPAKTFAVLCDVLDCTPNDLFEPFVEMRAAATAKTSASNQETRSHDVSDSSLPKTVSRPRKEEDPVRWPVPCVRCGQHHQTVARWPDGGVCGYCYQQAKRTCGVCACGHDRAAAILILVFGQQAENIARLTWDDISVTGGVDQRPTNGREQFPCSAAFCPCHGVSLSC